MATALPHAANPQPLPEARPHSYTILKSSQLCANCSTLHESSQLMVRCELSARYGMGASLTQLKALNTPPQFNLPIEIRNLETKSIPFCHECMGWQTGSGSETVVSHLPTPPSVENSRIVGLRDTNAGEARGSSRAPARVKNADDLLALFD